MQLTINGQDVKLDKNEVKVCRSQVADMIGKVQKFSDSTNNPTYLFTFLIIMHLMSQSYLEDVDPEVLAQIMNQVNTTRELIRKKDDKK